MTHGEYRLMLKTEKKKAQRMIFDEYYNYVYAIVHIRLRNGCREDVDECVSDVFSDVFTGDMKGFIGMIAERRATDYYRRLSRPPVSVSIDDDTAEVLPAADDVLKSAEDNELRRILLELIDSLGEPDATILIQKYFYNRNSREISDIVPLSPVMVRIRSSRALKKLRKLLSDRDISL